MIELRSKLSAFSFRLSAGRHSAGRAFTLVEMLVAMAITLVMMAAVVTLFANVSNSVRNRRATIEMTNQLRSVRNTLQQDLLGATCPGVTWQRPESNHGYIELIEGIQSDQNPTAMMKDLNSDGDFEDTIGTVQESQLNSSLSPIPRNNIGADIDKNGEITSKELEQHYKTVGSFVPGGLGDHDDILMLTVRNETEPFVGRTPTNVRSGNSAEDFDVDDSTLQWGYDTIESPLAEVVWFCIENPSESLNLDKFFGEPGIRTIYRRTLLIAPWVNPYSLRDASGQEILFQKDGKDFKAEPGLVRVLGNGISLAEAIASIIAFQDRYDLSVRLEWDHNIGRWKIMANTLADLTKRENRFGHFGFLPSSPNPKRVYPYPFISTGRNYTAASDIEFAIDPEIGGANDAQWSAPVVNPFVPYTIDDPLVLGSGYSARPFAFVKEPPDSGEIPATANAMLNDRGQVVRVTLGPAPLWGTRRGQDVMMTEVLGFDLRVYDPGAPLYGRRDIPGTTQAALASPVTVLQPSDPGWKLAYNPSLGSAATDFEFMGQGAYVDMGYAFGAAILPGVPTGKSWTLPWFAEARSLIDIYYDSRPDADKPLSQLSPGYSVYDTWSFHYENNGVDEDNRDYDNNPLTGADEGTNGFDDIDFRFAAPYDTLTAVDSVMNGPDDVGERETVPPYDKPLRGVQVLIRTYELDSRAIRQVRVNQHFLPE